MHRLSNDTEAMTLVNNRFLQGERTQICLHETLVLYNKTRCNSYCLQRVLLYSTSPKAISLMSKLYFTWHSTKHGLDWTGQLDWTIGLDSWTGQLDWTAGLDYWTGILFY